MSDRNEARRAAAICDNCGVVQSVRIGPTGEIRPIGTGQGTGCTCEDGDLRVLSDDPELVDDVRSETRRSSE